MFDLKLAKSWTYAIKFARVVRVGRRRPGSAAAVGEWKVGVGR